MFFFSNKMTNTIFVSDMTNLLTIFPLNFYPLADGADDGGMFPLAALLTGALLTIGVAVLLIVILAIKKNREQSQPHENGMKEKHIGWWS